MTIDSLVLIDKPVGMTSFGVVARVRRQLSQQVGHKVKVGHAGTLDPFATGLMIILTGKETKNAGDYSKLDKVYEATLILGKTSTTGDPEGEITPTVHTRAQPLGGEVEAVLRSFVGEITQTPPIYSAIKINGQRAYKLARQGKTPEMPTREVTIYDIKLLKYNYPILKIRVHCSSGTYIRSLAADIGQKLGTAAYTSALRRLKIGDF
ncbi:MAG: tRNA pseudouridine(55) synthase TruB, partial [Candidatus Nomurabacteria bacterium]|nr:tRNA pseudouridine(55) synthase TruB [Candidatus Nomurabacteria bacterium]